MTWNYRVTSRTTDGETFHEIREVYYDGDEIVAWSAEPESPFGETLEGLTRDLSLMVGALAKPILSLEELEFDLKERREAL